MLVPGAQMEALCWRLIQWTMSLCRHHHQWRNIIQHTFLTRRQMSRILCRAQKKNCVPDNTLVCAPSDQQLTWKPATIQVHDRFSRTPITEVHLLLLTSSPCPPICSGVGIPDCHPPPAPPPYPHCHPNARPSPSGPRSPSQSTSHGLSLGAAASSARETPPPGRHSAPRCVPATSLSSPLTSLAMGALCPSRSIRIPDPQ